MHFECAGGNRPHRRKAASVHAGIAWERVVSVLFCALVLLGALAHSEEVLVLPKLAGHSGGRLVVPLRAEPKTLNPLTAVDGASFAVTVRMHAGLVAVDRRTHEVVSGLARSWTLSRDGRFLTMQLRTGLRFSDGQPFDADDVVFTFETLLDPKTASPFRGMFMAGNVPMSVERLDAHRVRFDLVEPQASWSRLFHDVPVLPEHLARRVRDDDGWLAAWGLRTPPEQMAGLGPYRLREHVPGERIVLEKNPHYWKIDAAGTRLPYIEQLIFEIVQSEEAQILQFRSGSAHLVSAISPQSFDALERGNERGYVLQDLGPGLDFTFVFFNLNEVQPGTDPLVARKRAWFRDVRFRRAISEAVDREGIARVAYRRRAQPIVSHESPGNTQWVDPALRPSSRSVKRARALLTSAGFAWDAEQRLIDSGGHRVEFSLLVGAENPARRQTAVLLEQDLRELGMRVSVVPLGHSALLERVLGTLQYDGVVLRHNGANPDPNSRGPMLVSSGPIHLWQRSGHALTPWEEEIDALMAEQAASLDPVARGLLYDRVQEIVATELPVIPVVSPHVLVGARTGLMGLFPVVTEHVTLWNVDELYWRK